MKIKHLKALLKKGEEKLFKMFVHIVMILLGTVVDCCQYIKIKHKYKLRKDFFYMTTIKQTFIGNILL